MELDDFKNSWQQFSNKHLEQQHLDETQINVLLQTEFSNIILILKSYSLEANRSLRKVHFHLVGNHIVVFASHNDVVLRNQQLAK